LTQNVFFKKKSVFPNRWEQITLQLGKNRSRKKKNDLLLGETGRKIGLEKKNDLLLGKNDFYFRSEKHCSNSSKNFAENVAIVFPWSISAKEFEFHIKSPLKRVF